ncbi:MAG: outer membrane beta-barrel protein [Verrucomicrobia bacterium]|nr:outer membrane beta-barrel protein [Verrucomicrobiota bacterium]
MIKRTWLALVILGILFSGTFRASALDFSVGGFGSYFDADEGGDAYGGGALVRMGIFNWLAVDGRASYLELSDSDFSVVPLEAAATFRLPLLKQTLVPYGGVGVGYYLYDEDNDFVEVDDGVGFFPVLGLEFRFGKEKQWAVFGEARWLFLSTDIESAGDEVLEFDDDDIDGLGVNLGLIYRF